MADNVTFQPVPATPPVGAVVAADDVGGVLYQRVKLDAGGDGLASPVTAANPLPVGLPGTYFDAFGRLRVSETGNRFDVEFTHDGQPLIMDQFTAGAGTITHNATTRDVTLAVGNAVDGSSATFPGGYPVPYTPGSSQLMDLTGTMDYAGLGGGTASVWIRNNGVETVYNQASWNINPVADVDWSKSQILSMDFQSLKVGRLRLGLVRSGLFVFVHEIVNDNIRANGYWQHPNLYPVWRIYNSGGQTIAEISYSTPTNGFGWRYTWPAANAGAQMLAICGTVKSEGGPRLLEIPGLPFSAGNRQTTKAVSTTLIPLFSVRPELTFNGLRNTSLVIPQALNVVTDNPIYYEILLNATLTGAAFAAVDANSSVYLDTTASAVSGGLRIKGGYAGSGGTRAAGDVFGLAGRLPLSVDYLGTGQDVLTVAAVRVGAQNAAAGGMLDYQEIR